MPGFNKEGELCPQISEEIKQNFWDAPNGTFSPETMSYAAKYKVCGEHCGKFATELCIHPLEESEVQNA